MLRTRKPHFLIQKSQLGNRDSMIALKDSLSAAFVDEVVKIFRERTAL